MTYYQQISGRDVWVLVERPFVPRAGGGYEEAEHMLAAFRFDLPPAVIVGEYLRQPDGRLKKFASADEAANAAFAVARERISQARQSAP